MYHALFVLNKVDRISRTAIWDGGSSKIGYDVIIQQIQDGGLKLIDFGEKIKALKIIWVKRLTDRFLGLVPIYFLSSEVGLPRLPYLSIGFHCQNPLPFVTRKFL